MPRICQQARSTCMCANMRSLRQTRSARMLGSQSEMLSLAVVFGCW
jgi:hypothetical protein